MLTAAVTGHKRFGRTRRVQPANSPMPRQTRSLDQMFAASSVLAEHLPAFKRAGIDSQLALELDKSDLVIFQVVKI